MVDNDIASRQFQRLSGDDNDWREPLSRDYDIVLYSSAWRRLRGVTQVAPITDGLSRTHDRMLHSLKVAQVGMRLGEFLLQKIGSHSLTTNGKILPRAIEVAGLIHDLGHPPFGHIAEKELQECLKPASCDVGVNRWALGDSFEGNAQTFRIITRVSNKAKLATGKIRRGLDLTPATVAASVKYPWSHLGAEPVISNTGRWDPNQEEYLNKKWGFYGDDADTWAIVRDRSIPVAQYRSINALIMDMADDVTYALHDVHDYFRLGLIPLHEIGRGLNSRDGSAEYDRFRRYAVSSLQNKPEVGFNAPTFDQAEAWLKGLQFPKKSYEDSQEDRQQLHAFESAAVRATQDSIDIVDGMPEFPDSHRLALEFLKELTWFYVINHPSLSASQQGQRKIVRDLHEWLCDWARECYQLDATRRDSVKIERNLRRLPPRYSDLIDEARRSRQNTPTDGQVSRAAVDYLVGLTDAEAVSLHRHLGGSSPTISPVAWM